MVDWEAEKLLQHARELERKDSPHLHDVDDLSPAEAAPPKQGDKHPKLKAAVAQGKKTVDDCRALAEGLNAKMAEIGEIVKSANVPQGFREHLFSALGSAGWGWSEDHYASLRHNRIQHLDLAASVAEIQRYTENTINALGLTEKDYRTDLQGYEITIVQLLDKQSTATPLYLGALRTREALEQQVKDFEPGLAKASPADRPQLERQYEALKRHLEDAAYQEKTTLATLHAAQRDLPVIQQSRDAAAAAIQSIHGMRQSSLEKFLNFKFLLERATTALKAQARIQQFLATDPAFNAMVADISANNVSTAGAALEVWADRARKAAVDPAVAQKLVEEMLAHVEEARNDLLAIEGQVTVGERLGLIEARAKVPVIVKERAEATKEVAEEEDDLQ